MRRSIESVGGRRLAVEDTGAPDGFPVFLMHGTPGSRLGPQPRGITLYRRGIRLITYDRPGYGESTRHSGRRVVDAAADVQAIADELELRRFAVVGRSGGGPHALACAVRLPDRVTSAAAIVSLAPRNAAGLDWERDMTPANQIEFRMAYEDPEALLVRLKERMVRVREDPAAMLPELNGGLRAADRQVIDDGGIRRLLFETYRMAFHTDIHGHFDDIVALVNPGGWGFDPADVKVPTLLWHGCEDVFSPAGHTRWLARRIPGALLEVEPEAAHFSAIEKLPDALAWVVRNGSHSGAAQVPVPELPLVSLRDRH